MLSGLVCYDLVLSAVVWSGLVWSGLSGFTSVSELASSVQSVPKDTSGE